MPPSFRALQALALLLCGPAFSNVNAQTPPPPIRTLIIKADDVRGPTPNWNRFLDTSRSLGVKTSLGIIAISLEKDDPAYRSWLRGQLARGDVEFWDHGWDHLVLVPKGEDGKPAVTEFSDSGLPHQAEHLAKAQAALAEALGASPAVLGTPFNGFDPDTATALRAHPEIRMLMTNSWSVQGRLDWLAVVPVISGDTGTDSEKPFSRLIPVLDGLSAQSAPVSRVAPGSDVVALQFHPGGWPDARFGEYAGLIRHLQAAGWSIVLPSGYLARRAK